MATILRRAIFKKSRPAGGDEGKGIKRGPFAGGCNFLYRRKGACVWMHPLLATLLAILAAGAVSACGERSAQRELDRRARMAEQLARAVPAEWAGKPLRVIGNPFARKAGAPADALEYQQTVLRGLSKGLGRTLREEEVVYPALKEGAWDRPELFARATPYRTPLSSLMAPDAFDRLAAEHRGVGVFISIVGVPEGLHRTSFWTNPSAPRLVLYLPDFRAVPDPSAWRRAFENGRILAAVVERAGEGDGVIVRSAEDLDALRVLSK